MKDSGKRKRSGSITTKVTRSSGPGKALKHTAEDDLPFKLQTMQDMFASTRPVSALYVQGQEQDDPDLHPIQLTGEPLDLVKVESEESTAWQLRIRGCSIAGTSTLMSPLPSPGSVQSRGIVHSGCEASAGVELPTHGHQGRFQSMAPTSKLQQSNSQHLLSPPDQPVEVQLPQQDSPGLSARGIEPFKVDSSSSPLPKRPVKPGLFNSFVLYTRRSSANDLLVACFYILYRDPHDSAKMKHYQAVYLMKREAKELITSIAAKCNFEPTQVLQVINVNQKGLNIKVDDDFVRELPEGQDMILEVSRITALPVRHEWDKAVDVVSNSE